MSKEVVNVYMGEHGGKIVNINSVNSFSASPVAPVYHVAKAAEAALTQSCAAGMGRSGNLCKLYRTRQYAEWRDGTGYTGRYTGKYQKKSTSEKTWRLW